MKFQSDKILSPQSIYHDAALIETTTLCIKIVPNNTEINFLMQHYNRVFHHRNILPKI